MGNDNPHVAATDASERALKDSRIERGVVDTIPSNAPHSVYVRFLGGVKRLCQVPVTAKGDYTIPELGSRVFVRRREGAVPMVVGVGYTPEDTVPNASAGERVVSHPSSDARVYFQSSGDILVENGSGTTVEINGTDVVIDGGTKGAIYDVSTKSDSDGHLTDITLHRRSNILI